MCLYLVHYCGGEHPLRDAMINSMGVQGVPLVNSLSCLSITMIIWEAYFVNIAPIVGHNENLLFNVETIKLSVARAHGALRCCLLCCSF